MKRLIFYLCGIVCLTLPPACSNEIHISRNLDEEVSIFPDYKEVTIPVNIAPLDFSVLNAGGSETVLRIEGGPTRIVVKGDDDCFVIPQRKWKKLLEQRQGDSIRLTVCKKIEGTWCAFKPFTMRVAADKADKYVAYRLIPPGYGLWNKMGIYQRDVETYRQSPIYENKLTDFNCVNCHAFRMQHPDRMVFHMRSKYGGTVHIDRGKIEKLNTKTERTISSLVYPYWHPEGDYIAFSTNKTAQSFFSNHINRIEVFDSASDVVVYDVRTHQIISSPLLMDKDAFETFPAFSPDGKSLYFCRARAVAPMPNRYKEVHYNLCRIDFDAASGTFGTKIDTVYHAACDSMSVSFPRISPDGKYLTFTRHHFGNFSIWHKEADLYMIDLTNGRAYPLDEANSEDVDSYHSWSRNGRWLVFSSRRVDGLYTRLFFTYIDADGKAYKPFMLPQKNPKKYYNDLLFSYNIPEFVTDKVKIDRHAVAKEMREAKGIDVTYKE